MLESLQKLIPWVTALPIAPKIAITTTWLLLSFVFLYMVWVPATRRSEPQAVREAYDRMDRALRQLKRLPDGQILVDGSPVDPRLAEYYTHYLLIAEYISHHPGDMKGAYEEIWLHGGASRTSTDDTQAFEAVVSEFFQQYKTTSNGG